MIVKIHKKNGRTIVAVCDTKLLGQKIEDDNLQLDLTSTFYQGEEKTPVEIGDIIRNADTVNLVGEESVKLGIGEGIIEEENIMKVNNIPHAQASIIHED